MRTALRTALATALVAGVAITAPAFTAGAAFAADGPSAAPTAPSAPTPAATTSAPTATTPVPTATATTPTGAEADAAKGILVRTETLLNGTVAKIYKVKQQNHRAELFRQGRPVGVLEAVTRPAAGQDNGEFFVLNPDGTTHNWVGNTAPNTPGVYRLVDGTVLELGRKDGRFGLQLIENGKGRGYTYVNGVRTVWTFGKAVVVLEQDGQFSAYVPGSPRQAAPEPYGTGAAGPPRPPPAPLSSSASAPSGRWSPRFSVTVGA
ncbi:hypothetical protein C5L38_12580 [Streptomyces sp. WAC00288]|uniref:hypothetical protein n=1 Tax=unclassified Streptomyces TaxID=2593676 RepID=UPI00078860D9|nr:MULTISPECIES: hypothetical protein [unclassified Streptomyces]AVH95802.1 hypothetical protein C5L38_12580 [Streptomyces sp. WAC00288]KYG54467.1 hypothetical protein AWI43_08395 [Streptomyces sp. WAC04657]